jgi:hypothetical protein
MCYFFCDYKKNLTQTFSAIDEVCHLVSTGVKLVYIISSRFSYT